MITCTIYLYIAIWLGRKILAKKATPPSHHCPCGHVVSGAPTREQHQTCWPEWNRDFFPWSSIIRILYIKSNHCITRRSKNQNKSWWTLLSMIVYQHLLYRPVKWLKYTWLLSLTPDWHSCQSQTLYYLTTVCFVRTYRRHQQSPSLCQAALLLC